MTTNKVRLGDVIEITSGFAFDSASFGKGGDGLPLVRIRDVERGFSETLYCGEYDPKYLVSDGDLLVSMDGDFRIAPWKGGKAVLNQRVCRIEPCEGKSHGPYLRYLLPKELNRIEDATPFVTVKHLSVKAIREIRLRLPQLPEQRRIAAILDKADAIRRKREEGIRLTEELLRSTFLEMFGDPATNPKGWTTITLADCGEWVSGGTPSKAVAAYWNGDIPWISSKSLKSLVLCDSEDRITQEAIRDGIRLIPSGTVLFVVRGMSLANEFRVGFTSRPMSFNQDLRGIVPANIVTGCYLAHVLRARQTTILDMTNNATHGTKRLPTALLETMPVPIPPLDMQGRFEETARTIFEMSARRKRAVAESDQLFAALVQRAFQGEL